MNMGYQSQRDNGPGLDRGGQMEMEVEDWQHHQGRLDLDLGEPSTPLEMDSAGFDFLSPALRFLGPPPPGLPPRCHSEPIAHQHPAQLSDDLTPEDWPRRLSSSGAPLDAQDWQSLCRTLRPRVTFAERSKMHVYSLDPSYVRSKSYSKEERKTFGSEALSEAIRIKKLVLSSPGASAKDSFKNLLREKTLRLEEIVGIEHLVLGKSATKLLEERHAHAQAVLREQGKQRHLERMAALKEDPMERLGEFSASRSVKAAKRARIRAAMAA